MVNFSAFNSVKVMFKSKRRNYKDELRLIEFESSKLASHEKREEHHSVPLRISQREITFKQCESLCKKIKELKYFDREPIVEFNAAMIFLSMSLSPKRPMILAKMKYHDLRDMRGDSLNSVNFKTAASFGTDSLIIGSDGVKVWKMYAEVVRPFILKHALHLNSNQDRLARIKQHLPCECSTVKEKIKCKSLFFLPSSGLQYEGFVGAAYMRYTSKQMGSKQTLTQARQVTATTSITHREVIGDAGAEALRVSNAHGKSMVGYYAQVSAESINRAAVKATLQIAAHGGVKQPALEKELGANPIVQAPVAKRLKRKRVAILEDEDESEDEQGKLTQSFVAVQDNDSPTSLMLEVEQAEDEYEVEKIRRVDFNSNDELVAYVHWTGYDESEDSWEPLDSVGYTEAFVSYLKYCSISKKTQISRYMCTRNKKLWQFWRQALTE